MKVFTACAVRADRVFGFDKRYVHFDILRAGQDETFENFW
jgi:hypothetical protein